MLNKDGPKEVIKQPGPQVGYPIFWWAIRLVLELEKLYHLKSGGITDLLA